MKNSLTAALAQASRSELRDLAAFLTAKYKIQSFNAATGDCTDVQEDGIVMALGDWAALHGGKAAGKE